MSFDDAKVSTFMVMCNTLNFFFCKKVHSLDINQSFVVAHTTKISVLDIFMHSSQNYFVTLASYKENRMRVNEKTWDFISLHSEDDVRTLALRGSNDTDIDMPFALTQIAGRQAARHKLPLWHDTKGIIYPPHLNMEQCSSEQTARYKAKIAEQIFRLNGKSMETFTDITGGFGVDFTMMARAFKSATYVEQNSELCEIAAHNFPLLGVTAKIINADGTRFLESCQRQSLVFIDPSRRDRHGGRTYGISDCTPNITEILHTLLHKADYALIKLSPMLDIDKAIADLGHHVEEIHIVSVDNECKELLLTVSAEQTDSPRIYCVNGDDVWEATGHEITSISPGVGRWQYLYEPNASIMKAGCFRQIESAFGIQQIAVNSHLFVADSLLTYFPGRRFSIVNTLRMNKRELKEGLKDIPKANISVRNFPLTADRLRKRLKISDGGDDYIFATTLPGGAHILLVCRKI